MFNKSGNGELAFYYSIVVFQIKNQQPYTGGLKFIISFQYLFRHTSSTLLGIW